MNEDLNKQMQPLTEKNIRYLNTVITNDPSINFLSDTETEVVNPENDSTDMVTEINTLCAELRSEIGSDKLDQNLFNEMCQFRLKLFTDIDFIKLAFDKFKTNPTTFIQDLMS